MTEYMKLRNFVGKGKAEDPDQAVQKMAESLGEAKDRGHVQVRVVGEKGRSFQRCFRLDERGCEVLDDVVERPDFEIITADKTWSQIAGGSYSPVQAFLDGKMRVRGDVDLGERVLRRLGTGQGQSRC